MLFRSVGGEGGKEDVIALVKRTVGFAGISHIANMADETGGVFNGVAALWRERRVGSAAMHAAVIQADALVRDDGLHGSGFAHDAAIGPDAALDHFMQQGARAQTAHFFIV